MSNPKELITEFKTAPWKSQEEADLFVVRCQVLKENHLKQLINHLAERPEGLNAFQMQMLNYTLSKMVVERNSLDLGVAVIDAIKEADETTLNTFGYILVATNNPEWHPRLFQHFKNKRDTVRRMVQKVLSKAGGRVILTLIQQHYKETYPSRIEMIDTLAKIAGHHAIELFEEMLKVVEREEKTRILNLLSDEAYMKADKEKAGKAITSVLKDKDPMLRVRAVNALGRLGDQRYTEAISELLFDENPRVVLEVIGALGLIKGKEAVDALQDMTYHSNPQILSATVKALGDIGSDDSIAPLVRLLEHDNIMVRNQASEQLTLLGNAGKIDLARMLVVMMRSPNVNVRRTVVEMISKLEDKDGSLWWKLIRYLRDEDWWVRERVTEVLLQISGPQILGHVIKLLDDQSEIVRRYAVEVLIKLKDKRGLGPLAKAAIQDTDWWVRERAVEALGEMGSPEVGPVLLKILDEPDYQWVCVEALGKLKVAQAIPKLGQFLYQGDPDFRLAVIQALKQIGHPDIVPYLKPLLQDIHKDIRQAAADILGKFNLTMDIGAVEKQVRESLSFLDSMLEFVKKQGATDLYVMADARPSMRRLDKVLPISEKHLAATECEKILLAILSEQKREEFMEKLDVDTSYESQNEHYRFRVNVYRNHTGVNGVFRVINDQILTFDKLGIPEKVLELCNYPSGLVLVSGPSGSGKSTTLIALIDHINRTKPHHIVTMEDPIEYIHEHKQCLVNQREIGAHTHSFEKALRSVLREDPDVILIGEMRDKVTIEFAITAAETGHLVFGTLHTISAPKTIDRIIDVFNPHQQQQVRVMISESLRGVVCQQLLTRKDGKGRVLALEIMFNNDAVGNMIRQGKNFQIESVIATSLDQGMRLMDRDLYDLVQKGVVDPKEAFLKANDKKIFEPFFQGDELQQLLV